MWGRVIALALGAFLNLASTVEAQNNAGKFPGFDIPKELQVYTEEATILGSAKTVVTLLKSAKFGNNMGTYTFEGKTYDYDYGLKGDCDTPELRAFYRGIHLAHMAYNLFLSKQEAGWLEDKGAVADLPRKTRLFASNERNLLFRYWSSDKLGRLFFIMLGLLDLSDEQKTDLVTFVTKLREFRQHYNQLTKIGDEVDHLFTREDSGYYYETRYHKEVLKLPVTEAGLTYQELSKGLRDLINRTREPNVPEVSQCYVSEAPFRLTLGEGAQIVSVRLFTPVKYMVSFWRRRAAEGTENFADAIIARLILALRGAP